MTSILCMHPVCDMRNRRRLLRSRPTLPHSDPPFNSSSRMHVTASKPYRSAYRLEQCDGGIDDCICHRVHVVR